MVESETTYLQSTLEKGGFSMKNVILAFGILMVCAFALDTYAQEPAQTGPWHHRVVGTLALAQVAHRDWAKGGEDSLSWTANLDGKSVRDVPKTDWSNTYKFAFGQTKLGDYDYRKTEDKIDLETIFTYKFGVYANPYTAATLKTQFAKGYEYDGDEEVAVSSFFDPAYLTQSAGLGYQPVPQVKTRLGAAVREIITSEFTSYADDPDTKEVEKTKVDGGLESVTDLELQVKQNVFFKSRLELFAALTEPRDLAVRSDNALAVQVSRNITVSLNVLIVKDKTLSEKTQLKETLTLGLSYVFAE
jgi:hypothetical protein